MKHMIKAIAELHEVDEKTVSISQWDKVCRAKELLESGVSNELEHRLDDAILNVKLITDELKSARKVRDEILHERFDI